VLFVAGVALGAAVSLFGTAAAMRQVIADRDETRDRLVDAMTRLAATAEAAVREAHEQAAGGDDG
jgi:hypothetical protein